MSRLAMDVVGSNLDLSGDAKFTEAVAHKAYYGPVYFRRESEPYMTLALAGTRRKSRGERRRGQPQADLGRGRHRSRSANTASPTWSIARAG